MTLLEEVVALATLNGIKHGIKHVRTPEGAKYFGLPIGSPITPALVAIIKTKKAAEGIPAPPPSALSDAPVPKAALEQYKEQGYPVSDLGSNKHLDAAHVDKVALDAMNPGAGLHIVYNDGAQRVLTKNPDGTWAAQGFDHPVASDALAFVMGATDSVVQTSEGTPAPKPTVKKSYKAGDVIDTPEALSALDDGTHVQHKLTKAVYKKQGDTLQSTTGGYNKKVASLSKVFQQKNLQYHSPADTGAGAVDTADPEGPDFQPGTVLSYDQINGLTAGHQVVYTPLKSVYTSNGDGTFTADTTGSSVGGTAFQAAADKGKITYVGKKKVEDGAAGPDGAASGPGAGPAADAGPAGGDGHQPGDSGAGGQGGVPGGVEPQAGADVGSGNPDGNGAGNVLTLLTGETAVIKGPLPHSDAIKAWAAAGHVTPQLYELDAQKSAGAFRNAMIEFKKHNKYSAAVDVHDEADLQHMRLFMNQDGSAGIAIDGKTAVSLFISPDSPDKGGAVSMVMQQAELGANQLDAFDTVLPGLYAQAGFVPVARLKFNEEYAPEGWDYNTFGEYNGGKPDVVFMSYDPEHAHPYVPGEGFYVDDYDQGLQAAAEYHDHPGVLKKPAAHPLAGEGQPGVGETVTSVEQVTAYPVGTVLTLNTPGGEGFGYQKTGDNAWKPLLKTGGSDIVGDQSFGLAAKGSHGYSLTVKSIPLTDEQKAAQKPKFDPYTLLGTPLTETQKHEAFVPGASPDPTGLKDGDKIVTFPDGTKTKIAGQWTHVVVAFGWLPSDVASLKEGDPQPAPHWFVAYKSKNESSAHTAAEAKTAPLSSYKHHGYPITVLETEVPPLPDVVPVPDSEKQGTPIDEKGLLAAPVGSKVAIYDFGVGDEPPKTINYTKSDPWTLAPDADPSAGYGIGLFSSEFASNNVHLISTPDSNNLYDGAPPEGAVPVQAAEPDMTSPTVSLFNGAPLLSKNEVAAVLKSQQEASGFQVKYGFKGDAKNSPLNNPLNIKVLTETAQAEFPGIPAKPAVIAYLKQKLGIQDATPATPDDGAMIHIGAANPKSTGVQGLNGGDFTKAQIEDAIKILQAHQGKVFKSELAKKGSPLAALNPVSMIDAEKDKEANKQKFIALLQGALDDFNAKQPSGLKQADSKPIATMIALKDLPSGTTIKVKSVGGYDHFTSNADGIWVNDVTGDKAASSAFASAIDHLEIEVDSSGSGEQDLLPQATGPKPGDALTWEQAQNLKVGDTFYPKSTVGSDDQKAKFLYTVTGPNEVTTNGSTYSMDDNKAFINAGNAIFGGSAEPQSSGTFPAGHSLKGADFDALKAGDKFTAMGKYHQQVGADGLVKSLDENPNALNAEGIQYYKQLANNNEITYDGPGTDFNALFNTLKVGDALTTSNMKSVPVGAVVTQKFLGENGGAVAFDHVSPDLWINQIDSGDTWNDADFAKLVKHQQSVVTITKLPGAPTVVTPQLGKDLTKEQLLALKPGDQFMYGPDTFQVNHQGTVDSLNGGLTNINIGYYAGYIDTGEPLMYLKHADLAPEQKFPTPKPGDTVSSADILGATVGSQFAFNGHTYTKVSDGALNGEVQEGTDGAGKKNKLSTLMSIADSKKGTPKAVTWVSGGVKPKEDLSAPTMPENALGVPGVGALDAMKSGAFVFLKNEVGLISTFQKQDNGSWKNIDTGTTVDMSGVGDPSHFLFTDPKNLVQTGGPEGGAPAPKLQPIDLHTVGKLAPGQTISMNLGGMDPADQSSWITLKPNGEWQSASTGLAVNFGMLKKVVQNNGGNGFMHVMLPGAQKFGYVAPIDMQAPADFQQVWVKEGPGGIPQSFTFFQGTSLGWANDSDATDTISVAEMIKKTKDGSVFWDNPDAPAPAAPTVTYADKPSNVVPVPSVAALNAMQPGSVIFQETFGTAFTKTPDGMWQEAGGVGTAIPSANFTTGVKSGHVTTDPASLPAVKTGPVSAQDVKDAYDNDVNGTAIFVTKDGTTEKYVYNNKSVGWQNQSGGEDHSGMWMIGAAQKGQVTWNDPSAAPLQSPTPAAAAPTKMSVNDLTSPFDGMVVYSKENPSTSEDLTKFTYEAQTDSWVSADHASSHSSAYMVSNASGGFVFSDNAAPTAQAPTLSGAQINAAITGDSVWVHDPGSGQAPVKFTLQDTGWWQSEDGNTLKGSFWMAQQAEAGRATSKGPMDAAGLTDIVQNKKFGSTVAVMNDDGTVTMFEWTGFGNSAATKWTNLSGDGKTKSSLGMALATSSGKVMLIQSGDATTPATAPGDLPASKDYKAGDIVTGAELSLLKPGDLVKALPDATSNLVKQNNGLFVNPETGTVFAPPFVADMLGNHGVFVGHDDTKIFDVPYTGPDYLHTPKSHFSTSMSQADANAYTGDNMVGAAVGDVLVASDGTFYVKINDSTWNKFQDGKLIGNASGNAGGSLYQKVEQHLVAPYVKAGPKTSKYGITPGKYSTGSGAAYMVVSGDGSGVYVASSGTVKKLTVEAVKKNLDAGMTNYGGVPDQMPAVTVHEPKKSIKHVEDIGNGLFYGGGLPDGQKTSVYEVDGDKVLIHHPMPVKTGGALVGDQPTMDWAEQSGPGAIVKNGFAGGSKGVYVGWGNGDNGTSIKSVPMDLNTFTVTKQADGTWKDGNGKSMSFQDWLNLPNNKLWNCSVISHGTGEVEVADKKKINTLFSQGKLLDEFGNSVAADNYDGSITVLGFSSPVASLLKAKAVFDGLQPGDLPGNKLKGLGVNFNKALSEKYFSNSGLADEDMTTKWKSLGVLIGLMTSKVVVPKDDSTDAAKYFQYDAQGKPTFPAELVGKNPQSVGELNAYIKQASASVGDGKIIGLNLSDMDKSDKEQWVYYFQQGNFAGMYMLEVQAGTSKGHGHPSGFKHPGSTENPSTQQITWGPAVPGEKPASESIPGNWTTGYYVKPSAEEVSNYLIAAQMQNPTYLTLQERRTWMQAHLNHNQANVDSLSVTALNRKKSGLPEQSAPLAWTWNLKPAKTYDSMFEGADKNPTEGWSTQAAVDYYGDHWNSDPALQQALTTVENSGVYFYSADDKKVAAVIAYFQGIKDAEAAKALIPVYSKAPNQNVQQSTHPIYDVHDQFGHKYFFKPAPAGDNYRSEVEHLGNQFGKMFGFSTADSKLITLDGQYGNLQSDVGGTSSLLNFNFGSLSSQQIADIGMEHILDHFLDNDDTKGDNAKILDTGRIVGIDKGRAFKHFGAWKSLAANEQMDSNAATIYAKLYGAIRAGKFKKEDLDKAYLQIHKRAEKMQRVSDKRITEMLAAGMANRKQWDIKYSIDGKPVPNNLAGMTAAVLDRKNHLASDFDKMWAKVYKDAGLGALPEPPKIRLADDVPAGLDDSMLHDAVLQVNSHGKATALGGNGDWKDGYALLWTDLNPDGTKNVNGQGYLRPAAQKTALSWLQARAKNVANSAADPSGLELHDIFGQNFVSAAKTVNHHAVDHQYNQEKMDNFSGAVHGLEEDLAAWQPGLVSNQKDGSSFLFPSGQKIPMNQVDQYKLMLDHYKKQVATINDAYMNQTKIPPDQFIQPFQPIALGKQPVVFVDSSNNHKITKLVNGQFILNDGASVSFVDGNNQEVKDATAGTGTWAPMKSVHHKDAASEVKVTYGLRHDPKGSFDDAGHLIYNGKLRDVGGETSQSVKGNEYQVELPTGEKIWFINAYSTSTHKSQEGRVMFQLPNVTDSSDSQAAVTRVMATLQSMGIDATEADDTSAERTYWRSMYQILAYRYLTDAKHKEAFNSLQTKMNELGVNDVDEFLQRLSDSMTVEQENQFWENLWGSTFGKTRMEDFLANRGYLPEFSHLDVQHPEIGTGKPKFHRFDIDRNSTEAKGAFLASTVTGQGNTEAERNADKQRVLLDMVKSGGALSTEERLRYYGQFIGGWSSTQDQGYGSANNVYTRIKKKNGVSGMGAQVIYSPKAMEYTDAYSFNMDHFGDPSYLKSEAPADPNYAFANYTSSGNETLTPHADGMNDGLEAFVFDDPVKRQEAIDFLHKRGVFMIRGLPVEDRIIMRANLNATLVKVEDMWKGGVTT